MTRMFHKKTGGFTLVEIMIVVVIIGLLAAIAVPGWFRARKRSQAGRILEDLVQLDHANDEYAIDNSKTSGMNPTFVDLRNYLKVNSVLYTTGADLFGGCPGAGAAAGIHFPVRRRTVSLLVPVSGAIVAGSYPARSTPGSPPASALPSPARQGRPRISSPRSLPAMPSAGSP